jgi:hypothetical protein
VPRHDSHHCSVCSVLAMVFTPPTIAEAPEALDFVVQTLPIESGEPAAGANQPVRSRGPPASA